MAQARDLYGRVPVPDHVLLDGLPTDVLRRLVDERNLATAASLRRADRILRRPEPDEGREVTFYSYDDWAALYRADPERPTSPPFGLPNPTMAELHELRQQAEARATTEACNRHADRKAARRRLLRRFVPWPART